METVPRRHSPGDLRLSDADRDRAVAELSEHFEAGRLTADELEERTGLALRARTGNELAPVLADLPPTSTRPGAPTGGIPAAPAARIALPGWMVAVACVSLALTIASVLGHGHQVFIPVWLIPIAVLCVRRRARATRQERGSAAPGTGGPPDQHRLRETA
jgi:Domain of unknown function (DUF1707)